MATIAPSSPPNGKRSRSEYEDGDGGASKADSNASDAEGFPINMSILE